jgi:hypothetical protein
VPSFDFTLMWTNFRYLLLFPRYSWLEGYNLYQKFIWDTKNNENVILSLTAGQIISHFVQFCIEFILNFYICWNMIHYINGLRIDSAIFWLHFNVDKFSLSFTYKEQWKCDIIFECRPDNITFCSILHRIYLKFLYLLEYDTLTVPSFDFTLMWTNFRYLLLFPRYSRLEGTKKYQFQNFMWYYLWMQAR